MRSRLLYAVTLAALAASPALGRQAVTNGGSARPVVPPECTFLVEDGGTPGCMAASSAPTFGRLFPYYGPGNSFAPPAVASGGRDNLLLSTATFVGGGRSNFARGAYTTVIGGSGSAVGGGGPGGPQPYGTIRGGQSNRTDNRYGRAAVISGGLTNLSLSFGATVSGGRINTADGWRYDFAYPYFDGINTVTGGERNVAFGDDATVSGGRLNETYLFFSTVRGGLYNKAMTSGATVGGGSYNTASFGYGGTISGGTGNRETAYGSYGGFVVCGGAQNEAREFGVVSGASCTASGYGAHAHGRRAQATLDGAFVWGDSTDEDKTDSADDELSVYASGGSRIFSDAAGSTGVLLAPGAGSWSSVSDRGAKADVAPIDHRRVLEDVVSLEISTWNYRSQRDSIRHMGPMAQDFHTAFGIGASAKAIDTVDSDGVVLAAIRGLDEKMDALFAANAGRAEELRRDLADLRGALGGNE